MGHCDPHIHFVPSALINFVLKIFSPFAYKQIKRVIATAFDDPASPFAQRIQQKVGFYGWIRSKVDRYLAATYGPQAIPRTSETALKLANDGVRSAH